MSSAKTRSIVVVVTLLLLISSAIAGAYTQTPKTQKEHKIHRRTYDATKVTKPPKVISKIQGLEIYNVSLVDQGKPYAAVNIDVINHRDEAVMAVDFIAGSKDDFSGMSLDGLLEEDRPRVIIPPNSLKSFTWYLAGIFEEETIALEIAIFADGKEEGDKQFLEGLKKGRSVYQQGKRGEKGGPK